VTVDPERGTARHDDPSTGQGQVAYATGISTEGALFGPPPVAEYVAFADGVARGLLVKELEDGASVGDLVVLNPTDANVLLYEGEEVLGAQQNRTFDVSVLVAASRSLRVPVSCVEHGRWDGARHGEAFRPAPQAAYPSLRAMKNRAAHARGRPLPRHRPAEKG